ncbi:MAG TPA: maleylpyruvate isomerase family mycothiol-dependent enzyme [Actinomycetota bacterium]
MTLPREWLLSTARAEREAMGRSIQYTEPRFWEMDSVLPGWRNRDIVAHLAAGEQAAAESLGGQEPAELEAARKAAGGSFSVDAFNASSVARRAQSPLREVIGEWGTAADLLLSRAAALEPAEYESRRVTWVAGELRVPYLLQSRVMEWWLHGEDLRAGVELPPRRQHEPIHCTIDLAIRMIPYALGLAGLSFPGKSMRFIVEGSGQGDWHYGLAPHETPPPAKRPDAAVEARGYDLAMVAGRRFDADEMVARGAFVVGGDRRLAETVLRHLRAFAA